jgi:MFS family permease
LSGLEVTLAAAAFVAGLTGTWSPCGFSMIETIGPVGHRGGRATTLAACATFTIGALVGGVLTFGALAALGALTHGAGDGLAYGLAAAIALAGALAELRGAAIVPQVRRQLPEHWRRLMPMPVAAGLYGILLGLGFTTFVLTFGVFALAGIVFAVGEPAVGLAVGLAFGIGRALPVTAVAPVADRPAGIAITELMAGRPAIYRGFRLGDGVALIGAAVALTATVPAGAANTAARPAADPATGSRALVYQRPDRTGVVRQGVNDTVLPGRDPAIGDGRVAVVSGGRIVILSAKDLTEVGRVQAPGADAVAISGTWLAWRARVGGRDVLRARNLRDPSAPGPEQLLGRAGGDAQLGRPSLDGNRLVYARATGRENVIVKRLLGAKRKKQAKVTLMRSIREGLSNPTIRGDDLLYVRHTRRADRLKLATVGGGAGRTLLSRHGGTLWSTALSKQRAYVTLIHGTRPRQRILSVGR